MRIVYSFTRQINIRFYLVPAIIILAMNGCKNSYRYEYTFQNPSLEIEARVNDLISRMTLDEKIAQLSYDAPAIDRLGIPAYNWWGECLHGVARAGRATVFPQSIGLAATFDKELIHNVANAISDEARAKHHQFVREGKRNLYQGLTFWSPNINIFRDPRWGRGMETYGEDPYLTGKIGVSFIRGLQGNDPDYFKVIATVKHFVVHSGPEPERHGFNAQVSVRDFRDTYLPAFRMAIREANVQSVMCAYNRINGKSCCGSDTLLNQLLREELGFDGYVVSDCGALADIFRGHQLVNSETEAAVLALRAGTDLNCGNVYPLLSQAVRDGLIRESEIDLALSRLLKARFSLGMFDPPEEVAYAQIPYNVVDCKNNRMLALETARKSIVLLKNETHLLPIDKNLRCIAVIGPNANDEEVLKGNYSGYAYTTTTPLQGIKKRAGPNTRIIYEQGCEWAENMTSFTVLPDSVFYHDEDCRNPGLLTEFFDNMDMKGDPLVIRSDSSIDVNWWDGSPLASLEDDDFSVRWTGYIKAPRTGEYLLGGEGLNRFTLYLEDSLLLSYNHLHHERKVFRKVRFEAGKSYQLRVEFSNFLNDAFMRLIWSVPDKNLEQKAIAAVKKADVALVFLGLSPRLEGEEMDVSVEGFRSGDRLTLDLPAVQEELLKKIAALGKPVVLVLLNGSALSINWAKENIPAIIEAWYPGQAAGEAIADVIFGNYNPAGRLPLTFYKSTDPLPPFENYSMQGRTYRYFTEEVLFPFGYGLSYTTFNYGDIKMSNDKYSNGDTIKININITNTGAIDGEEVVQLYLTGPATDFPRPIKELKGFERIFLSAGITRKVSFELTSDDLEYYNEAIGDYTVDPGEYRIGIGPDSENLTSVRFFWMD
ncbi:MAG: glycoside hydrolase family 3 C-terminal domain-containing protein [Bacteroidales bacterium]|nr:glycoside hydrolase family 3 C-terminal domain-containing protein [Bacteroidales bacterium]